MILKPTNSLIITTDNNDKSIDKYRALAKDYRTCDSLLDMCSLMSNLDDEKDDQFIKDTILSFCIEIHGLPCCPDEDLPLQVYLSLDDLLDIKISIELCAVIDHINGYNVIGVMLNSQKTKREILLKAASLEGNIKIKDMCRNFQWILDDKKDNQFIKDLILSYCIEIHGLPCCPDEDLPLQVYLNLNDQLDIKFSIKLCAVIDHINGSNVIVVMLNSQKTKREILLKAASLEKNIKIKDMCRNFQWILENEKDNQFIKDLILSFCIEIHGLPCCPDEDLPLQVYLSLNDLLDIKFSIELCAVIDHINGSNVIGVMLNSQKTKKEILLKASSLEKNIKIKDMCGNFQWILDNYQ